MELLLVAGGGVAGTLCRYYAGRLARAWRPSAFPIRTLLINVLGSFLLGMLTRSLGGNPAERSLGLLLGTGFCGAFTTFSSWAWETVELWQAGKHGLAVANAVLHPLLAICAAGLGLWTAPG